MADTPLMATVRAVPALRTAISAWKRQGFTVGFVPTMGALPEGHLTLVREAARRADRVVASVFVNPTQFAAHEDLGTYPRTEARDAELLAGPVTSPDEGHDDQLRVVELDAVLAPLFGGERSEAEEPDSEKT